MVWGPWREAGCTASAPRLVSALPNQGRDPQCEPSPCRKTESACVPRAATEGWPSGLRHTLGKRAYVKAYREFESHPLRHSVSAGRPISSRGQFPARSAGQSTPKLNREPPTPGNFGCPSPVVSVRRLPVELWGDGAVNECRTTGPAPPSPRVSLPGSSTLAMKGGPAAVQ